MRRTFILLAFSFAACLVVAACNKSASTGSTSGDSTNHAQTPVERGKYLVLVGGCNDCHTPWVPDGHGGAMPDQSHLLSGSPANMVVSSPKLDMPWMAAATATMTAWSGPWGVSYSANLTPDSTGLGKWDEATFLLALRNGKHIGNGRPIMPPMPWEALKQMTDEDLKAIFAYLKTVPPINNTPPEYQPPGQSMASATPPPSSHSTPAQPIQPARPAPPPPPPGR